MKALDRVAENDRLRKIVMVVEGGARMVGCSACLEDLRCMLGTRVIDEVGGCLAVRDGEGKDGASRSLRFAGTKRMMCCRAGPEDSTRMVLVALVQLCKLCGRESGSRVHARRSVSQLVPRVSAGMV